MKERIFSSLLLFLITVSLSAQRPRQDTPSNAADEGTRITPLVELKATPVKDQAYTSTCWCFAATSFIESELIRLGKGEFDLSEMFIVRYNYIDRMRDNYLRQGKGNISPGGGQGHDWMIVFKQHGIVPDEVYSGLLSGAPRHNHGELNDYLSAVADIPVKRKKESPEYYKIVNSILDTYLGPVQETFTYKGKSYTPESFAESLGINPDDYVEITSFSHFPFYSKGVLEVPDNWRMERFFNVPVDELIEIMDYSLNNGFTVDWDGDTSERTFSHINGIATFPGPVVTQESRQAGFENFTTTDDHCMHVTGLSKDQNGNKYYITKNSYGTETNKSGGYLNMSENYVRAKTIFILVHKNAIPPAIRIKLGIV